MKTKVADLMSRNVQHVLATQSVSDAARMMRGHAVGMVVVLDGGRPVGVLTDRDIAVRVVADGLDPDQMTAVAAASQKVVVCHPEQSLVAARALMEENMVRRLVVNDERGAVVGVLSLEDLASVAGSEAELGTLVERLVRPNTKA